MPVGPGDLVDLRESRVAWTAGAELGRFRAFLPRGNVVDLAVGIVVSPAFGNVAQALIRDVVTPLLSVAGVYAPRYGAFVRPPLWPP